MISLPYQLCESNNTEKMQLGYRSKFQKWDRFGQSVALSVYTLQNQSIVKTFLERQNCYVCLYVWVGKLVE